MPAVRGPLSTRWRSCSTRRPPDLDRLWRSGPVRIHPIAAVRRFRQTDIQNLLAKNVSREEIAASIFHAVAVQTVERCRMAATSRLRYFFCGGPLVFLPSLRKAFAEYLHLDGTQTICPADAQLLPAWGTALSGTDASLRAADEWLAVIAANTTRATARTKALPAIFENEEAHTAWRRQRNTGTFLCPCRFRRAGSG